MTIREAIAARLNEHQKTIEKNDAGGISQHLRTDEFGGHSKFTCLDHVKMSP
jgi:hypothetical protein